MIKELIFGKRIYVPKPPVYTVKGKNLPGAAYVWTYDESAGLNGFKQLGIIILPDGTQFESSKSARGFVKGSVRAVLYLQISNCPSYPQYVGDWVLADDTTKNDD